MSSGLLEDGGLGQGEVEWVERLRIWGLPPIGLRVYFCVLYDLCVEIWGIRWAWFKEFLGV